MHSHVEGLEARRLLSVSAEEYAAIRDRYSAFILPADIGQVHVIEIGLAELGAAQLKGAIAEAAGTASADLIVLRTTETQNRITYTSPADVAGITIAAGQGDLTIVSLGAVPLTINAAGFGRAVSVTATEQSIFVRLGGLVLTGGAGVSEGGGLYSYGASLVTQHLTISGNAATGRGGGLYQFAGSVGLYDTNVEGNATTAVSSLSGGGGIYGDSGFLVLNRVRVENNTSVQGGGIYGNAGRIGLVDSTIAGNSASNPSTNVYRGGGGFLQNGGESGLQNVVISENSAAGPMSRGGGIGLIAGTSMLTGVRIERNSSTGYSGGMAAWGGATVTARNTLILGNAASWSGGGIWQEPGSLTLTNSTLVQNSSDRGGGAYLAGAVLYNTLIARNAAPSGRDVLMYVSGTLSGANNLIGDGSGQAFLAHGVDGNLVGTAQNPIDPRIVENAGTDTEGMLVVDSPAVDAGDAAWVPDDALTDVYGNPRVQGAVNIGAVEPTRAPRAGMTYIVNSLADTVAADGLVTFREALEAANSNTAVGDAPAGSYSDRDVIVFAPELTGIVRAHGTAWTVSGTLTINGTGSDRLSLQGLSPAEGRESVLTVGQGSRVVISGITLSGGTADYGGGISSFGSDLELTSVVIAGNWGWYGGGVYARHGATLMRDVAIHDNTAGYGGGIYLESGDATLERVVVHGNTAWNDGGGIKQFEGRTALWNTIIADNDAASGGGLNLEYSALDAINTTISRNMAEAGGGVWMAQSAGETGTVRLHNTIIAGNDSHDIYGAKSGVMSGTHNVLGWGAVGFTNGVDGNVVRFDMDPMLAEGTSTGTGLAPLPGSPAIDAGDDAWAAGESLDVYGRPRVQGDHVNIGAVEDVLPLKPGVSFVVNSLSDEVKVDGVVSLREAMDAATRNEVVGDAPAGSYSSADRIEFAPGLAGTIKLGSTSLEIRGSLQIVGPGTEVITIDAGGQASVLRVRGLYYGVTIEGLTLTGGYASMGGGITSTGARLTVARCQVVGNEARSYGGGIYQAGGTITLEDVILSGNMVGQYSSNGWGGGIYVLYGTATVTNSVISENTAISGGGVMAGWGNMQLTNVTISRNSALTGSGISLGDGVVVMDNSIVAGNDRGDVAWDSYSYGGGTFEGSHNLIGVNRATRIRIYSGSNGNIVGTPANPVDAKLADDVTGGPVLALLPGSPAIDAGDDALVPAGTTTDVYGRPRVLGARVNMGAVESVVWPAAAGLSSAAAEENQPAGTPVGTFSAADPERANTFSYALVVGAGTDNALFAIVGDELRTASTFDYEAQSSYTIRVRITDQNGIWFEKAFTISITDVDEIAPTVSLMAINDGAVQRSMVKQLSVVFSEPVLLSTDGVQVKLKTGAVPPNTTVTVSNPSGDQTTYILTFSGSAAIGGSLPDGIYDLIVNASGIQDLTGNPLTANYSQRFHRLFGDSDGNRIVNALDYARLKQTFGRAPTDPLFNSAFDYEGNNLINALDLARFRQRYGMSYSY